MKDLPMDNMPFLAVLVQMMAVVHKVLLAMCEMWNKCPLLSPRVWIVP